MIVFPSIPGPFLPDTKITKRTHFLLLMVKSAEVAPHRLSNHSKATLAPQTDLSSQALLFGGQPRPGALLWQAGA